MMTVTCPQCEQPLQHSGDLKRHCEPCQRDFKLLISCHECGHEIERLRACGAVSFWCPHCNELKSKSSAVYSAQVAS